MNRLRPRQTAPARHIPDRPPVRLLHDPMPNRQAPGQRKVMGRVPQRILDADPGPVKPDPLLLGRSTFRHPFR